MNLNMRQSIQLRYYMAVVPNMCVMTQTWVIGFFWWVKTHDS